MKPPVIARTRNEDETARHCEGENPKQSAFTGGSLIVSVLVDCFAALAMTCGSPSLRGALSPTSESLTEDSDVTDSPWGSDEITP